MGEVQMKISTYPSSLSQTLTSPKLDILTHQKVTKETCLAKASVYNLEVPEKRQCAIQKLRMTMNITP